MPKVIKQENIPEKNNKISNDELAVMIQENSALTEENLRLMRKVHSMMIFGQIMWWFKFLIVVASVIIAFNFLPPYLHVFTEWFAKFQQIQGGAK